MALCSHDLNVLRASLLLVDPEKALFIGWGGDPSHPECLLGMFTLDPQPIMGNKRDTLPSSQQQLSVFSSPSPEKATVQERQARQGPR